MTARSGKKVGAIALLGLLMTTAVLPASASGLFESIKIVFGKGVRSLSQRFSMVKITPETKAFRDSTDRVLLFDDGTQDAAVMLNALKNTSHIIGRSDVYRDARIILLPTRGETHMAVGFVLPTRSTNENAHLMLEVALSAHTRNALARNGVISQDIPMMITTTQIRGSMAQEANSLVVVREFSLNQISEAGFKRVLGELSSL